MSGFGDLTDSENDDEWDQTWASYASGEAGVPDAMCRGVVELPIGNIEIRGVDIGLVERLPASTRPALAPVLVVEVDSTSQGPELFPVTWTVTDRRNATDGSMLGQPASGECHTMTALIESVTLASIQMDTASVYVDAVMIDNGEIGVAIVGLEAYGVATLERAVDSLISPWWVISEGLVAFAPRSRTVTGLRLVDPEAADPTLVAAHSCVDVLVSVVDPSSEPPSTGLAQLDPADALDMLLGRRVEVGTNDEGLLAEMLSRAKCFEMPASDTASLVAEITALASELHEQRCNPSDNRCAVMATIEQLISAETQWARTYAAMSGVVLVGAALDILDRGAIGPASAIGAIDLLVSDDRRESFASTINGAGFVVEDSAMTVADLRAGAIQSFRRFNSGTPVAGPPPSHDSVRDNAEQSTSPIPNTVPVDRITVSATLACGPFAELVDMDDFHDLSRPVRVGRTWIRGLCPAHRYIAACLQLERDSGDLTARESARVNLPVTQSEAHRVVTLADRCGALSVVREATLRIRSAFPDLTAPLLEELGH